MAAQYASSANLDARVRIYELFDTNPEPWHRFVFACLRLAPGERVLEVGCGTGSVWSANAERLPAGLSLVLSDLSPGMLEAARRRLAQLSPAPELRTADAQSLPFPDASFDVAIANHMLYHVPDRARALAELARVLRPGGRLVASTYPWTHLLELRELTARLGLPHAMLPVGRSDSEFDLETALLELARVLRVERVERRDSALAVTDPDALVAYLRSTARADDHDSLARIRAHVARQIELCGAFRIQIAGAALTASRPPAP
ncbi:MAG TPA: methyltransferase domain-containing protein [Myxococcota bacterium]|nr:methyltransferase domain-containing protein [Myxococcota bacterium]